MPERPGVIKLHVWPPRISHAPFRMSTQYNRLRRSWALFVTAMLVAGRGSQKVGFHISDHVCAVYVRVSPKANPGVLNTQTEFAEIGIDGGEATRDGGVRNASKAGPDVPARFLAAEHAGEIHKPDGHKGRRPNVQLQGSFLLTIAPRRRSAEPNR